MANRQPPAAVEDIVAARMHLVRAMLARVRKIAEPGMDRERLLQVESELKLLAARRELFPVGEFPPTLGGMYRLSEDPDHRYALYIVAPAPGGFAPRCKQSPHQLNLLRVVRITPELVKHVVPRA